MRRLAYDGAMIGVLWRRDLILFFKQPSRLAGALITPLLLWLAIGAGIAPSFATATGGTGYMEYLFPGIVFVLVLQVSISATISVIEDRRQGFLQGVLAAPGSRTALMLGKAGGSATVALLHAVLFVLLAPLAGFGLSRIAWWPLLVSVALTAVSLTGLGFAIAWALDSVQGYHVLMNLLLFPMWILSGAMFPADGLHPVLGAIVRFNPLSYAMAGMRRGFYGGELPLDVAPVWTSPTRELVVTGSTTLALLALAAWVASRPAAEKL